MPRSDLHRSSDQAEEPSRQKKSPRQKIRWLENHLKCVIIILFICGLLAQLGEHLGHNQVVVGSSPAQTTMTNQRTVEIA